ERRARQAPAMASPSYIAPEHLNHAPAADTRADIYSLGCTLYHLLAGQAPFQGTVTEKLRAHEWERPRPLAEVRKDVPAGLDAVLGRLLAKDPRRRYQTPAEVAEALAPFAAAPGARLWRWAAAAAAGALLAGALLAGTVALSGLGRGAAGDAPERWRRQQADEIHRFRGHPAGEGVWGVAFSPDGGRAVSCGADGYVRQWDVAP